MDIGISWRVCVQRNGIKQFSVFFDTMLYEGVSAVRKGSFVYDSQEFHGSSVSLIALGIITARILRQIILVLTRFCTNYVQETDESTAGCKSERTNHAS